jgi:bacterial/archaeal transporter family protein
MLGKIMTTSFRWPAWLLWSLATIALWGLWGLVSKLASDGVDAYTNQLLYTAGLLPLMALVLWSARMARDERGTTKFRWGVFWAFLTGVLGGTGNIAFFQAFVTGGKVSIVTPVTALFPVVTVALAVTVLRERIGKTQVAGLLLAFVAIYLLSM